MAHGSRTESHEGAAHPPTLLLLGVLLQSGLAALPTPTAAFSPPVRAAGALLILIGVALNVSSSRAFVASGTPKRPLAPPVELVTGGAFRFTRNPMYLGLVAVLLGNALLLANAWALLPVPPFAVRLHLLILREEALLDRTFGDGFARYRTRVRRWL